MPHQRRSLLPGLHIPIAFLLSEQKSLPLLRLDGRTVVDSSGIIEAMEEVLPRPNLYPASPSARRRALELEDFFDEELGPHIRCAWFFELLPHTEYSAAMLSMGAGPWMQRLYRRMFPVIRAAMRRDMRITAETAEVGRAKTLAALDRIVAELQPSGYLVGDQFSVADLTAAALLSPVVLPPEFPYPPPEPLPLAARAFRDTLSSHPAFQWAAEMYRRHRGRSYALNIPPFLRRLMGRDGWA